MSKLTKLADSFLKLIGGKDSQAAVDLELGYRNQEGLRRVPEGFHILANFIEGDATLGPAFAAYRRTRRDEIAAEEAAAEAKAKQG